MYLKVHKIGGFFPGPVWVCGRVLGLALWGPWFVPRQMQLFFLFSTFSSANGFRLKLHAIFKNVFICIMNMNEEIKFAISLQL